MRRYRRFVIPAVLLVVALGMVTFLLLENTVFFNTPTELVEQEASAERQRLGGQVVAESVVTTAEGVEFEVTDGRQAVAVVHTGAPQALFQEGIGVVVEGTWDGRVFSSDAMLVKHDEQYRTSDGEEYVPGDPITP